MVIPAVETPADASASKAAAEQHAVLPGSRNARTGDQARKGVSAARARP